MSGRHLQKLLVNIDKPQPTTCMPFPCSFCSRKSPQPSPKYNLREGGCSRVGMQLSFYIPIVFNYRQIMLNTSPLNFPIIPLYLAEGGVSKQNCKCQFMQINSITQFCSYMILKQSNNFPCVKVYSPLLQIIFPHWTRCAVYIIQLAVQSQQRQFYHILDFIFM